MTDRPTRVILHAGFHKTGTTSAQNFLRANRAVIWPHAAFALKFRFEEVTRAARAFSNTRDAFAREKFRFRFIGFLGRLPNWPGRPLVIASEELLGHMPGHKRIRDFSAAPELCEDMADALRHHWGEDLAISFLFTTRAAEDWLASAWAHCVMKSGMKRDAAQFAERYRAATDFEAVAGAVRERVGGAEVRTAALEEIARHPLGPGSVYLDALGLPEDAVAALRPIEVRNRRADPADVAEKLARNQARGKTAG